MKTAGPGAGPGAAEVVGQNEKLKRLRTTSPRLPQLKPPRPMRPDELPAVRQVWWSQATIGHRLPAERGVIVIQGGRP